MLEIPEAQTIARQLKETVMGKTILSAVAAASPHGFAWYFGEPSAYGDMLNDKKITGTAAYGGRPEIWAEDMHVSFGDGVNIRYLGAGAKHPLNISFCLSLTTAARSAAPCRCTAVCGLSQMV